MAGSAGSGGAAGGPLTCAEIYSETDCGVCGEKLCCKEAEACAADANCLACLQGDDTKCVGTALGNLNTCLDTKCKTQCTGTCNDGGTEYTGATACTTCQDTELAAAGCCGGEATKCGGNAQCVALNTCLGSCADQACVDKCAAASPNGIADYNALVDCLFGDGVSTTGSCGTVCQ
jgi:hypothetical protein